MTLNDANHMKLALKGSPVLTIFVTMVLLWECIKAEVKAKKTVIATAIDKKNYKLGIASAGKKPKKMYNCLK